MGVRPASSNSTPHGVGLRAQVQLWVSELRPAVRHATWTARIEHLPLPLPLPSPSPSPSPRTARDGSTTRTGGKRCHGLDNCDWYSLTHPDPNSNLKLQPQAQPSTPTLARSAACVTIVASGAASHQPYEPKRVRQLKYVIRHQP